MPSYDATRYSPAAPVAPATLRNPLSGVTSSEVVLLLDTGADITLLPRKTVEELAIPLIAGESYELVSFDGSRSFAPAVTVDMIFLDRIFRGRYLLIEEERGILGRDILNHVLLLLDGPRQYWQEYAP
jgi:Aspartyl protease